MSDPAHALDRRASLPGALRVLLADYPRAGCEASPNFDGLVRFWLDRHMMFRRILGRLLSQTQARLDGQNDPEAFRQQVAQLGGVFVQELHMHHRIEDTEYFPILSQKDARIAHGFGLLDADHHALDGQLNGFVSAANAVLQAGDHITPIGRFHDGLVTLSSLLDRHLTDEEELIVPVILKHGPDGLG